MNKEDTKNIYKNNNNIDKININKNNIVKEQKYDKQKEKKKYKNKLNKINNQIDNTFNNKEQDNKYEKHEKYFKGNPEITFFKKIYKKTSNFNISTIEQDITGNIDFGRTLNCSLNKSGDLIRKVYLEIILPDLEKPKNAKWYGYTNNIGCSIIKNISFNINEQLIEKLYGDWIDIYYNINNINYKSLLKEYNSIHSIKNTTNFINYDKRHIIIPIPFFFTKNNSTALPLIALNNSNISINIELRKLNEIIKVDNYNLINSIKKKNNSKLIVKLFTEVIYLDTIEKQYFINKNLEYLIETVQFNDDEIINKNDLYKNINVDFRYLVKQFIWTISVDNSNLDNILIIDHNNITKYTTKYSNYDDTFDRLQIKINNNEIIDEKPDYYRKIQSYLYYNNHYINKHIYSYSFSINPLNLQPSGYINLSNINDIMFSFKFKDYKLNMKGSATNGIIKIYAINYNILKIVSGMASLLYTV